MGVQRKERTMDYSGHQNLLGVGGTWAGQEWVFVRALLVFEIFRDYFKNHYVFQQGWAFLTSRLRNICTLISNISKSEFLQKVLIKTILGIPLKRAGGGYCLVKEALFSLRLGWKMWGMEGEGGGREIHDLLWRFIMSISIIKSLRRPTMKTINFIKQKYHLFVFYCPPTI